MNIDPSVIIAVDFDGTCVSHEFPEVGADVPGAVRVLKRIADRGAKIILWTMRSDNPGSGEWYLEDARRWFSRHNIPLYGVNSNPSQSRWTSSPKAYAHHYVDDAALGCPLKPNPKFGGRPIVDWDAVEVLLFGEPNDQTT